jgi:hypothetical protein
VQNTDAFIGRSTLASNSIGVLSETNTVTCAIESAVIVGNNIGVQAGSTSSNTIFLSRCLITRNLGSGLSIGFAGSQILGYSNNVIANNGGSNTVTASVAQQ